MIRYSLFICLLSALLALPAFALQVRLADAAPDLVRQTPYGEERLIYLALENPDVAPLEGVNLEYEAGGESGVRALLPIPQGEVWDTVWVCPKCPNLKGRVARGEEILWEGLLEIPALGEHTYVPYSPAVELDDLKPLMLRGTNYYPQYQPWPGLWRAATDWDFARDCALMSGALYMNTFRTFYNVDTEWGLTRPDGAITPRVLARFGRLLGAADENHLKVMLCIGGVVDVSDLNASKRFFRTGVEPFVWDGRVLMWDVINEPGGADGPKATPELAKAVQELSAWLSELDGNHLWTVGLTWQFDQLWELGVKPPVGQYHDYSGAIGVQPEGQPPVRNVAEDLANTLEFIDHRPLIIGEFGMGTAGDRGVSLERQQEIYQGVLEGAEVAGIAGVYNWTLYEFAPDWMGKYEQSFGIVRVDGTLKPAGETLRDYYRKWRAQVKAPWED